jgi:hypothetical protein
LLCVQRIALQRRSVLCWLRRILRRKMLSLFAWHIQRLIRHAVKDLDFRRMPFRIMQLERSRRDANHKTGGLDPRSVKRMIQDPKCHLRLEDVCWHM